MRSGEERGPGRRALLRGALGVLLGGTLAGTAGCEADTPRPHALPPDPLQPLYAGTADLIARYDATIAGVPALAAQLTPIRTDHAAHLDALAREIGAALASPPPAASAVAAPADRAAALAALVAAERAAGTAARSACLSGPSYRAALLGSITAARASHVEDLSR